MKIKLYYLIINVFCLITLSCGIVPRDNDETIGNDSNKTIPEDTSITPILFQYGSDTATKILSKQSNGLSSDNCNAVAVDGDFIYCSGNTTLSLFEQGENDVIVVKMNKNTGEIVWSKQIGRETFKKNDNVKDVLGVEACNDLEVDGPDLYCVGSTTGSLFENNGGSNDIFFLKLNKDTGHLIWGKQLGADTALSSSPLGIDPTEYDTCNSVSVNSTGVYCAGETLGSLFETNADNLDIITVKLDKNTGDIIWAKQIGSSTQTANSSVLDASDNEYAKSITTDDDGVYIAGYSTGGLLESSLGGWDAYILKLNPSNGEIITSSQFGSASNDTCNAITIDDSSVFCAGNTNGDFGDGETNGGDDGGAEDTGMDAFIISFSKDLATTNWKRQLGSTSQSGYSDIINTINDQYCLGVSVDSSGVYCAGYSWTNLFEPHGGGDSDAIIFKLNKINGEFIWGRQIGLDTTTAQSEIQNTGGTEICRDVISDNSNVYCVGNTSNSLFENILGSKDLFVLNLNASDGEFVWGKQIGETTTPQLSLPSSWNSEYCNDIVVDDDYIYCTGSTLGSLFENNGGSRDIFIKKIDKFTGNIVWTKQLGKETESSSSTITSTSSQEIAISITLNSTGLFCTGYTNGDLFKDNQGSHDGFIVKIDKENGGLLWGTQIGGDKADYIYSVKADEEFIYAGGYTKSELYETSGGNNDIFLVSLKSSDGAVVWEKQLGQETSDSSSLINDSSGDDRCRDLEIDEDRIYCSGYTTGNYFETSSGGRDSFITSFEKVNGNIVWGSQLGDLTSPDLTLNINAENDDFNFGVTVNSSGVYASGYTNGDLFESSSGEDDLFIYKLDKANGSFLWGKQIGTEDDDVCYGLSSDETGIYCAGTTKGGLFDQTNAGNEDVILLKLNSDSGNLIWGKQLGKETSLLSNNILNPEKQDRCNNVFVDNTAVFCAGETRSDLFEYNGGFLDSFILKINKESGSIDE